MRLLLLLAAVLPALLDALADRPGVFWIAVNVREIAFQPDCIQDRNCDAMTFSMVLDSNTHAGTIQTLWSLDDVLQNPLQSEMTAAWHDVRFTNITLRTLLTSMDALFGVARPCDQSSPLHVFSPVVKASPYNAPSNWRQDVEPSEVRVLGLVGKCFHSIVEVRLFTERCPWCRVETVEVNGKEEEGFSSASLQRVFESPFFVGVLFGLLLLTIGCLIVCAIVLRRTKRSAKFVNQYAAGYPGGAPFGRHSAQVSSIPLPPMLRPPITPSDFDLRYGVKNHEPCPYYETLDNHIPSSTGREKEEKYDSAFDQSCPTSSPNSSFSTQHPNTSDSGRSSPPLVVQTFPRAEYV
ncbi:hypothetical protein M3Y99_00281900 [Aphelenchoides fujianensis]|nr:hypothetical protein M3Y99_00281900 [Aphelenchoides fujianensis]